MNDMLRWSFTLKVAVLEPYTDLNVQLQGGEDFPLLQDEVLEAVEEVIQRRAGSMKGLAQVRVVDVEKVSVKPMVYRHRKALQIGPDKVDPQVG